MKVSDSMADNTYTHIVVGAGSAGCVVAARIAENRDFSVLLLESGPDCDTMTDEQLSRIEDIRRVPMRGQSEVFDPALDWSVDVDLPNGGSMKVPQAKVVGGGSSINGGTALRSTVADSKEWVELGNDSWNFDSIYQSYESLEEDEYRGTNGPHPIMRTSVSEAGIIQRAFLHGAAASGFPMAQEQKEPALHPCAGEAIGARAPRPLSSIRFGRGATSLSGRIHRSTRCLCRVQRLTVCS
jgi:choline dehydrogenase